MTFDEYQELALRTAAPKSKHNEIFHLVLGLAGETGEVAEKFKKLVRDHDSDLGQLDKDDMAKELGDVLWYIATLAAYLNLGFDDLAVKNIAKLTDRMNRDVIKGKGDNR